MSPDEIAQAKKAAGLLLETKSGGGESFGVSARVSGVISDSKGSSESNIPIIMKIKLAPRCVQHNGRMHVPQYIHMRPYDWFVLCEKRNKASLPANVARMVPA